MNSSRSWICGLIAVASLAYSPATYAQTTTKHPSIGMMRRFQQAQKQQAKNFQAYQKAFAEWRVKAEAEAIKQAAEKKAEVARRKEKADADRQARAAKNKQHNAEAAAKAHEKPAASDVVEKLGDKAKSTETDASAKDAKEQGEAESDSVETGKPDAKSIAKPIPKKPSA